jgi:hypothetical protein
MAADRPTATPKAVSKYEVHWLLNVPQGRAEQYSKVIRQAWWTFSGVAGERRLSCDHAGDMVVVVLRLTSDDLPLAIDETRALVIGPLVRAGLPLPESVVVIARTDRRLPPKSGVRR